MVRAQRERVLGAIRTKSAAGTAYPGLDFSARPGGYLDELATLPGVAEAGWRPRDLSVLQLDRDRVALQARLADFLQKVHDHDDAWPFREAVDTSLVPTYLTVVRDPIDLSLIGRRVADGYYNSVDHFLGDISLMFANCRAFNHPDTEYVACAKKLDAFVRARVAQQPWAAPAPAPASASAPVSVSAPAAPAPAAAAPT